jgi:hypothetical protein
MKKMKIKKSHEKPVEDGLGSNSEDQSDGDDKVSDSEPDLFARYDNTVADENDTTLIPEEIVDYIILDTEGTDLATPEYRMYDERARELFLRQVQVEIADKFVYVTSKFNQKSQWNIKKLTSQLSFKDDKAISERNRLTIVHNLIDVEDEDTLTSRIREVQNCYTVPREPVTWKNMKSEVHVEDKKISHVYYQTKETNHLFMVRQPKEYNKGDWRCERNAAVVQTLKNLLNQCNPRKFNLLEEFLKISNNILQKIEYLKGWDDTYELQESNVKGRMIILPKRRTGSKRHTTISASSPNKILREKEENYDREAVDGWEPVKKLELNNLQVTDVGEIIPEGKSRLDGNVCSTKTEHILQIHAPGVSDIGAFAFDFHGTNSIVIHVLLPNLIPKANNGDIPDDSEFSRRDLKGGKSFFKHSFPEHQPFLCPTSDQLSSLVTLENGILTIHLQRTEKSQTLCIGKKSLSNL